MGDIKVGDIVDSPEEGFAFVLDVFNQGMRPCYKFEFNNGKEVECDENHLWKVSWRFYITGEPVWEVVTTRFIMEHCDIEFKFFEEKDIRGKVKWDVPFDLQVTDIQLLPDRFQSFGQDMKLVKIEKIGEKQQKCIFLTGNSHLYYTDNDVITHNSIVIGGISEMAFFREAGFSDAAILNLYSKLKQRISSRMRGNYYGRMIIDTSPNDLDSPIDNFIVNDASKSKENFILQGARWQVFKNEFKNFYNVPIKNDGIVIKEPSLEIHDFKTSFAIYKGGNGIPPQVLETEGQYKMFDPIDCIWCPRMADNNESYIDKANENCVEFLKDMAGIPSGTSDRIFYDHRIIERIFDNNLKNLYLHIDADAMADPESLIWNKVKDIFFYQLAGRYYYYYEPSLARSLSVDQSYAKDNTCITLSHVERDPSRKNSITGESMVIYVSDFTLNIIPIRGSQINLDAIRYFIMDLIHLGNLNIQAVSFDYFESMPARQALKRAEIPVDYISVDKIMDPYLTFIGLINQNRYFCGKNIYLKNNLKSLQIVKRKQGKGTLKIDHTKGELITSGDTNWETSLIGRNAKDSSDSTAASVYLLTLYPEKFVPYKVWGPVKLHTYESAKDSTKTIMEKLGLRI
jgi:hypothetical protein